MVQFFDKNRKAFKDFARESYRYAKGYVASTNLPLRPDDVATILVPALTTNEPLREYLAGRKLKQKFWYRDFADLILDREWEELRK